MIKKVFTTLLIVLLTVICLPLVNSFNRVDASTHYAMACDVNEFEVSYIENDGSLSKVKCYSNFPDAKAKMKENEDYVVRYSKSYSSTKIIAMNSGLAYTYPARRGSITMYLYQKASAGTSNQNSYKYTYLTDKYEMNYYDTLSDYSSSLKSDGKGFIKISMNGFDGYCELEYTDLVPFKYIKNAIPIYLGGYKDDECSYNHESPYKIVMKQNYYKIETNGNYKDLVFHYYRSVVDGGTNCYDNTIIVDNAKNYLNAGMVEGQKYYSNDGINFYSDSKLNNFVAQVYGYYQFLSVRTKTNITAKQLNKFLASVKTSSQMMDQGQAFINAQNNYGSNALIIYAMACQESGYGTSYYADDRCNLFGWGAYDSDPGHASGYSSIEQCINQHMGRNLDWFMDCTNWRYAGTCVGNKGTGFNMQYASDPYWGNKIAAIAYRIDKFANGNNGNLSDYNAYTTAVVHANYNNCFGINTSNWNTTFYKKSSGSSAWHTSKFNDNYQKDLTVAIVEQEGNRYKVNTANPITNGAMYVDDGICKYDWDKSIAYIDVDRVTLTNKTNETVRTTPTYEQFTCVNSLDLKEKILTIEGLGVIQGVDFNVKDNCSHKIVFYSFDNQELVSFDAENVDSDGYDMNDGYDYKYAGFVANIDLTDDRIGNGSYYLAIRTTCGGHTVEANLKTSSSKYRSKVSSSDNLIFKLSANPLSNYRLELDIMSSPLDYLSINKPSARTSMVSFDDISFDEEGNLNIYGQGLINGLDFNNKDNVEFKVYLVKDIDNYLELDTRINEEDTIDYSDALNSDYNLSYISFIANGNVLNLNEGNYLLILKIKNISNNVTYTDFVEFTNRGKVTFNEANSDTKNIKLQTSNIRKRIELVATDIGE